MKGLIITLMLWYAVSAHAQTNCAVYKDKPHQTACELYNTAITYSQGSLESQTIFLKSIQACPTFAPSLHEMSVPYLKRGDFYTWKLLIDRAVNADPQYLNERGWCQFKFLRDYTHAYADLKRLYVINGGQPGYSGDGDYDLRIVMALALRELGNYPAAMHCFNECIDDHQKHNVVGVFDYLHRGVTYYKNNNYKAALKDLLLETKKYEKLADTYYYIGQVYIKLNLRNKAMKSFLRANDLYTKTGYHRTDPYCEVLDQVYLSDIDFAIKKYKI